MFLRIISLAEICILLITATSASAASHFKVLHSFKGGKDGANPKQRLLLTHRVRSTERLPMAEPPGLEPYFG